MTHPFPELLTMSLDEVAAFIAGPNDACISITERGDASLSGNFAGVLRVHFADIPWPEYAQHEQQITAAIADQIVAFALHHRNARRLVIHCAAGASRSVSTAMSLSVHLARRWWFPRWFNDDRRRERWVPNPNVFNAIAHACERAAVPGHVVLAPERQPRSIR